MYVLPDGSFRVGRYCFLGWIAQVFGDSIGEVPCAAVTGQNRNALRAPPKGPLSSRCESGPGELMVYPGSYGGGRLGNLKSAFSEVLVRQAKIGNNLISSAVFRIPVSPDLGTFSGILAEFCYTGATQTFLLWIHRALKVSTGFDSKKCATSMPPAPITMGRASG